MEYQWIRKQRNKRMYLRIKQGNVVVTTPYHVSKREVDAFVVSHSNWIKKQLDKQDTILQTGDTISFFGKSYTVIEDNAFYLTQNTFHIVFDQNKWNVFLCNLVEEPLKERFQYWAFSMGYADLTLRFGFYRSKWGSCRKDKREVRLNYYLGLCDWNQIDAILVHELCHLKIPNHSKLFYQEVYHWMPDYDYFHAGLKHVVFPRFQ